MNHQTFQSNDSAALRQGGSGVLSLALMDARNQTLALLSAFEASLGAALNQCMPPSGFNPPLWTLSHLGWFQEYWIARNLQRQRGPGADPAATRLASVVPQADLLWRVPPVVQMGVNRLAPWDPSQVRAYLLATLETTLELLDKTANEDDALYFYRLALFHEDRQGEALVQLAQMLGVSWSGPLPAAQVMRPAMWLPSSHWQLGRSAGQGGFSVDNEQPLYSVAVPEFEIDAQLVTWAQYVEFVQDGGYDRADLWQPQGWQWLQTQAQGEGRRCPRYVEQMGASSGAVTQTLFGKALRMQSTQPVMHVSWWEADAWCRWAGRRLPAEVEWDLAAHTASRRGFTWGEALEWTGTTFRGYPGFQSGPWREYSEPSFGTHKALRGASFATRPRLRDAAMRYFLQPERDDAFTGFRSCAL
jgi:ergothioneine biosynthesis protein EgtB